MIKDANKNMITVKKRLGILLVLSFIAGLGWVVYKISELAIQSFSKLDSNTLIAIIAGMTTILASTLAVVITRYYQAKADREMVHRDKKIELYDKLLTKIFEMFGGGEDKIKDDKDMTSFLREIQRKIVLWSGPDVIKTYAEWHCELTNHFNNPRDKAMIGMINIFLALRRDLGHSNRGIEPEHLIRFLLKNSELFMQMYRKDPDVTLKEIDQKGQKSS